MKKLNNLLKILTAQVMTIAIVLTLVEIAGQLYAFSILVTQPYLRFQIEPSAGA